ncbi:hypothetical protein [Sediminibacterium soli]|uniref:hypothetical protein n=1 Tax=Sediminibacterium soli TaxID=2698829 RepID=UPI00137B5C09|nr:hypothetical protein [Sediminibacterium soli]NCI45440.1 hypothetical protein [Sediminibacterium soli]
MRRIFFLLLTVCIAQLCAGQRTTSLTMQVRYGRTAYDITRSNNPSSLGMALQLGFLKGAKLQPHLELGADLFPGGNKVLYLLSDGTAIPSVSGLTHLYAGLAWHPSKTYFASLSAGTSVLDGRFLFGVRPVLSGYLTAKQTVSMNLFWLHVFNRDRQTGYNLGTAGIGIGIKLF